MPTQGQLTGMQGVYLVAAELAGRGLIASLTSRSARGADILVTDPDCRYAFSLQVKTNSAARDQTYWLVSEHAKQMVSPTHFYIFVNIGVTAQEHKYFIVPSKAPHMNEWAIRGGQSDVAY